MKFKVKKVDNWIEVYLPRTKGKEWTYARGFVDKNDILVITDVFVSPELRKKGVGSKLVRRLIDESGCEDIRVNNVQPEAVGFWSRMRIEEELDARRFGKYDRKRERYMMEEGYLR